MVRRFLAAACFFCSCSSNSVSPPLRPPKTAPPALAPPERDSELARRNRSEQDDSVFPVDFTVLLAHQSEPMGREQRGDWEQPDALLIAYDDEWTESLSDIIRVTREELPVYLLAGRFEYRDFRFRSWLKAQNVSVISTEYDTPWIRDYGPNHVYDFDGGLTWVDFKYSNERPLDDAVPKHLRLPKPVQIQASELAIDGGGLISNGAGLCAMTDYSLGAVGLIDPGQDDYRKLLNVLGCDAMAILPALPNETTGHVDVIAQFLGPDVVAVASVDPELDDEVAAMLDQAARALLDAAELLEQRLRVVRVPMHFEGEVFYSYVNVSRLKHTLLIPHYRKLDTSFEERAHAALRSALPGVRLAPIAADAMVARGGAIHCVTLGVSYYSRPAHLARRRRKIVKPARSG